MTFNFCTSPDPITQHYLSNGNGDIVYLCNSHLNYFMDIENKDQFVNRKYSSIQETQFPNMFLEAVTNNHKFCIGLQGTSDYEG